MPTTERMPTSSLSNRNVLLSSLILFCWLMTNGSAFSTESPTSAKQLLPHARRSTMRLWSSRMSDEENYHHPPPSLSSSDEESISPTNPDTRNNGIDSQTTPPNPLQRFLDEVPFIHLFTSERRKKLPPVQVDDVNVMLYDVFLIVNLSLSISFWVTHRMDFSFLPAALNEGCLFSILWICSGLYHGSFLFSAMDGHYPPDDPSGRGGPKEAAALAFNTFINAINLRLVAALLGALLQHRQVGMDDGMEQLIPLEISCGIVLMTMWRALHSSFTPRV